MYQLDAGAELDSTDLKGIIAASITPVTAAFGIDSKRLTAHVERLLAEGCSFVSTFGTTGEGASLSTSAKLAALDQMKQAGQEMGRQIPAVMTPVLDDAAELLAGYGERGCRAVLVLPPFYYGGGDAGIADWFDALVARTPNTNIDLLLYNIPQLSRVRFTRNLVAEIVRRHGSRIVGVKDSTGEIDNGVMLATSFPQLSIFTGDDRVLPQLLAHGGAGLIGGLPNVFARDLRALFENPADANLLARQTERILAVDRHGSLVALKAALAHYLGDEAFARALPPLRTLDEADRAALLASFAQSGFSEIA